MYKEIMYGVYTKYPKPLRKMVAKYISTVAARFS